VVQRADIEAKAKEIEAALQETKESAQNTAVMAGVAILLVVIVAYFLGNRKGKAGKTLVEVYRVK
jgi:UDP-N-acetylmuramyl pentapeptide phosphotransferase/UDP-N-acetylglucosamine-1-phosphate transferase